MTRHLDPRSVLTVRKVAAEVLQYPDDALLERLPVLTQAVAGLPLSARQLLAGFLDHLAVTALHQLQQDYVATFDMKRKCCLYLSYYLNGDTRRRGMALVAFKDVYRRAGMTLEADELPDYLPVVLEFAAVGDADSGEGLLVAHRRPRLAVPAGADGCPRDAASGRPARPRGRGGAGRAGTTGRAGRTRAVRPA
jgi:nitrate reductase molybdenum cofactor assembly chaperone